VKARYSSFDSGIGKKIEQRKTNFDELEAHVLGLRREPMVASGRQEMLENVLNDFIA
jgi:xylose isomerase